MLASIWLFVLGCTASVLNIDDPSSLPDIVKEHKTIVVAGRNAHMVNAHTHLFKGDFFTIFAKGEIDAWPSGAPPGYRWHHSKPGDALRIRIGESGGIFNPLWGGFSGRSFVVKNSGLLYIGHIFGTKDHFGKPKRPRDADDNTGAFTVDTIVWADRDYERRLGFLDEMKRKNPKNKAEKTPAAHKNHLQRVAKWTVVIGISEYRDSRIPSLRYAAADAKVFYDWLVSPKGGRYVPNRVKCLIDENATNRNIQDALFLWLKKALAEDVVVIADACYAGGVGHAFDMARRANRGLIVNPIASGLQDLTRIGDGICVISGSDTHQFSQESEQWGGGHGVFTYFLIP